jgi:metal-responsive CopG/Arc/MetJ family transcriptional regulator
MKTAVSIPEPVFKAAERLAKRLKKSRSGLYADALREYVARHDPAAVTASIDEAIAKHGQPIDPAILRYNLEQLRKIEW